MKESITNAKLDFLSGGGVMGELIRSTDWSKTPLGSPETWPQSLRTSVNLCIASNFPIAIAWGPQRVQIYNDGYWPITGDMHPASMGQDFKECWISAWPVIGEAFEEAFLGETRFLENQRIFLERYGYTEETFFTFSFSPILDETGGVGGLFHPVIEQTQQTLAERRLNILPAVANHAVNARTTEEASALILDCLKDFALDLPFVLLYSIAADGKEVKLKGSVGIDRDSPLAPAKINLEEYSLKSWPFTEVIQNGKAVHVEELSEIFGAFKCGPYPEPPKQALVFPVILPGAAHNNYFLVAGVSSRRSLDEKYLLFYELLTATVTNVLTKARVYEEERRKAEALAEIDRAKTVFFSNISHEFRTPLTLMLSPLEELLNQKQNNFSEGEKQNIETTHRNAMRLLKLVNTLLDFSRIESGRQQAMFSLVDIVALTKNLASNFRSVIEKAGLKLIVKTDTIIQPVYVDRQMWEKIVFNLLSNAFKYTLKGSITVELTSEKDFALLKIKDTGVGIPENELPKMFERFHRVQNVAGRTYEGTGIGLSLIKELVQMHKGTITVESKLNKGSIFTVKIPFGKEHLNGHQISKTDIDSDEISSNIYVKEIETLLETEKNGKPSSVKEKNTLPTVLVVDDNADMREHISSILSNNFNVITANNGMDALRKMKETIPSLVLSDIMMPVMDGIGLLKEIKSNKATAKIPVIFLTARAGEESRIEGLETGADDYLVKPFSAKELVARVRAQIKMVKLRQSLEGNLRNLFLEAPALICVFRGPQHVYELANEMFLQLLGNRDIIGKPAREVLSEAEGQGYFELLDNVYSTGEPFIGNEMPAQLDKGNGKLEEVYFNFVYQPSHNSEGEIDGVLVYGVDVTEQVLARKKIEESEAFNRTVLESSPDCIKMLDEEGRLQFMNSNGICLLEIDDFKSVENTYWWDMWEPHNRQIIKDAVATAKSGEKIQLQLFSPTAKGTPKWWDIIVLPVQHDEIDQNLHRILSVSRDITEQKQSELKEKELLARFQTLVFQAPVAICVLRGKDYVIEVINEGMREMWDRKIEDIINIPAFDVLPEFRNQGLKDLLDAVYTTGERIVEQELPLTIRRNERMENIFVKFVYEPLREADGTVSGVMALAHEITEQVVARKKLEESEERFRSLAQTLPQLVWVTDAQGNAEFASVRWKEYSGIEPGGEKEWKAIVHPDDYDNINAAWVHSLTTGDIYTADVRLKSKNGLYRWHGVTGEPVLDKENKIVKWVGAFTDIHEQKSFSEQLEEKVNERTIALNEVNENLEEKNIELQKMNKELEAFTYVSSHDLQEPLRKIQTFAGRITATEKEHLSENAKDYFKRMNDAATRMQTLIHDLLAFSRVSTSERKFETADLTKIVDEVKGEFKEVIEEKNANIVTDEMCEVKIIPFQFRQLMHNLMSNALKFTNPNVPPRIVIKSIIAKGSKLNNLKLLPEKEYCHISFSDNGIGFEKQFSEKIYEVFQKLHRKEQYSGTGIGLAIVKKIVDNHHGIIMTQSELGRGTTFNIYLPV